MYFLGLDVKIMNSVNKNYLYKLNLFLKIKVMCIIF